MKNKIAIVTVYNAYNYGSFLQANASQTILSGGGGLSRFFGTPSRIR